MLYFCGSTIKSHSPGYVCHPSVCNRLNAIQYLSLRIDWKMLITWQLYTTNRWLWLYIYIHTDTVYCSADSSSRLHHVPKQHISLIKQSIFTVFLINPNPPCQLSLREENGEPGENPRLSAEFWQTLPTCDQMIDTVLEPMTSVVGGRRLDDWATEAPLAAKDVL